MLPAVRRSEGQRGSKPVAKVWKYGDIGRANGICRSWTECGAMLVATASPLPSPRRRRANLSGIDARLMRRLGKRRPRSEEHTSELQSLMRISYAVFCLKKKKQPSIT